jgi:heme oxygenase
LLASPAQTPSSQTCALLARALRHHALSLTRHACAQVAYHSQGRPPTPPLPATAEYTARLAALSASQPLLLLAYAQTLYVALLAGGRTLEAMLRCARALPVGSGTAIFDFEAVLPRGEQRRFRDELKQAIDALGARLTGKCKETQAVALCAQRCD